MAAGLDRDDTVIRRRLRQKLEFLPEDAADTAAPTDAQLQAWLDATRRRLPARNRRSRSARSTSATDSGARRRRRMPSRCSRSWRTAGPEATADKLGDATMLPPEFDRGPSGATSRRHSARTSPPASTMPKRARGRARSHRATGCTSCWCEAARPARCRRSPRSGRLWSASSSRTAAAQQLAAMYERLLSRYTVVIERRRESAPAAGKGGS